jgi:hypothetical protein
MLYQSHAFAHFQPPAYRALSCIQLARVVRGHLGLFQPPATLVSGSAAPAAVRVTSAAVMIRSPIFPWLSSRRHTAPREREMRDQLDQLRARNAVVESLLQVERQLVCAKERDQGPPR